MTLTNTNFSQLAARSMFSLASTAALALGTFLYAMPAHAAGGFEEEAVPTVLVRHADLDLRTQAGRDTLLARVNLAVEEVCANQLTLSDPLHGRIAYQECRKDALHQAERRIAAVAGRKALAQR